MATEILVFDFELFIGDLFTSISYVGIDLSTKAAETEIRAVYKAHASGAKSKEQQRLADPFFGQKQGSCDWRTIC